MIDTNTNFVYIKKTTYNKFLKIKKFLCIWSSYTIWRMAFVTLSNHSDTLRWFGDIDLVEAEIQHFSCLIFHVSFDLSVRVPLPLVTTLTTFVVINIVITLTIFVVIGIQKLQYSNFHLSHDHVHKVWLEVASGVPLP